MKISTARGPISGDSANEKHRGWIELMSFSYEDSHPSAAAEGTRQPRTKTMIITKLVDRSSDALQRSLTQNMTLSDVIIDICKGATCSAKLLMKGVTITEIKLEKIGSIKIERISLTAQEIAEQAHESKTLNEPNPTQTEQLQTNKVAK